MFTTLIVQPIFNLLVLIYNLIPGHNFGLAIILFTIVIRLMLWPLVKKQLHQTKLMRRMQPELKRVKAAAKGDRQKEALLMMELYKERGVKPLRSIGIILLQLPILLGLYIGLTRVLKDRQELVEFSYPFIQNFAWMKELATDIGKFDESLFGLMDLTRSAIGSDGLYWPALLLVTASAAIQFFQSKQLMPQDKDARSLRQIMKDAGQGKQADQSEVSAAVGRGTLYLLPAMVFLFTVQLASALSLYWLVGGIVAFIQQSVALRDDGDEMNKIADEKSPRSIKASNNPMKSNKLMARQATSEALADNNTASVQPDSTEPTIRAESAKTALDTEVSAKPNQSSNQSSKKQKKHAPRHMKAKKRRR